MTKQSTNIHPALWILEVVMEFFIRTGIVLALGSSLLTLFFTKQGELTTSIALSSSLLLIVTIIILVLSYLDFKDFRKLVNHPYVTTRRVLRMVGNVLGVTLIVLVTAGFIHYGISVRGGGALGPSEEPVTLWSFTREFLVFLGLIAFIVVHSILNKGHEALLKAQVK